MTERDSTIILYGSYGYTGRLIAQECRSKKLTVILAGRNTEALQKQSEQTGYDFQSVDINERQMLDDLLTKGSVVIHCAGPFHATARLMAEACLRTKTHYVDITGEYQVFELLASFDQQAKESGITILPGAGFDVVPTDCLALHLKERLPSATHLQLAFRQSASGLSRGTGKTMIEVLGYGSMIRKDGKLTEIPLGKKTMEVNFGPVRSMTLNIPWGDIATAWRTTGIPNIEVYMSAPGKLIRQAKMTPYLNWLLRQRWLKNFLLKKLDQKKSDGPSEDKRSKGTTYLWGKASDQKSEVISTLEIPNGYTVTARTSVLIAQKIMNGKFTTGYQTPAMAYGKDLILETESTRRTDIL